MLSQINKKGALGWVLALAVATLAMGAAPALAADMAGGDSPQAVFDAAQVAGANKDFHALTKLVAPSEQPMMAFGTDMGVGMMVEFYEGEKAPELKQKYEAVQQKYGVDKKDKGEELKINNDTPQEVIDAHIRKRAQMMYGDVDVPTYVAEMMGIIINMPEMGQQAFFPQEKLTDLKVEGDKASGKAGDKTIHFMREGGRWYLTADVMK